MQVISKITVADIYFKDIYQLSTQAQKTSEQ